MRFYGKKNIRSLVDKRTKRKQEMRDAILWSIDGDVCRVKIQGSSEMVVAKFPRNQKEAPLWLRPGNAVRIVHKDGVRGYIEVAGEGRSIPTPISGGTFPDTGGVSDGIISGLVITPTYVPSLAIEISAGVYRINGIVRLLDEVAGAHIIMDDPAPMVMGTLPFVLNGQVNFELSAAPAIGLFRYDIIVVDESRDLDLIEGAESASNPVMPTVPDDHLLVDFILRVGGDTVVTANRIGILWEKPHLVELIIQSPLILPWSFVIDNPSISVQTWMKDQYGSYISSSDGYKMVFTKICGTGDVWSLQSGWDNDEVEQDLISSYSYTFMYRRDQAADPEELTPFLQLVVSDRFRSYSFEPVILLDSTAQPI